MNIDIRTLILIIGVTHLIQLLVFYYQYRTIKAYKGPGWWLLWCTAEVIGFLAVFFRDFPSVLPLAIIVQNTAIISGTIFIYVGLMRFMDKKVNLKIILPAFSAYFLSLLFFIFVRNDIVIRSLIINFTLAAISFFTAFSLFRNRIRIVNASVNFNTVVLLLHGGTFAYRFVMILLGTPVSNFFSSSFFNLIPFIDALIVGLLWTFGFIIMVNQRLNAEMKEAKEDFEMIFNASPDAALITRVTDGCILEINSGFTAISGYSREESVGKSSVDILWKNEIDRRRIANEIQNNGSCENIEAYFQRKDGTELVGLMSAKLFRFKGIDSIISITRDITLLKQKEKQIRELNESLEIKVANRTKELQELTNEQAANQLALLNLVEDLNEKTKQLLQTSDQLQAANKELETFTYSVSHDLKAPLRGIDGYSKLLLETHKTRLDEEGNDFLRKIRSSTARMNQLIDDLLEYSRLERSQMRKESIRIPDLFVSLLSSYKDDLEKSGFKVEVVAEDVTIEANLKGLTIALRNLFENAIKFSGEQPDPTIKLSFEETSESWVISVVDNGIGFDMKYSQKIFEIFQRLHRAEDFPGTGIGLAMVSKAMQRMNGKAWAESEPGNGSAFYLEIPKNN